MTFIKISTLVLLFLTFQLAPHSNAAHLETEEGWYQKTQRLTTTIDRTGSLTVTAGFLTLGYILYQFVMNPPTKGIIKEIELNGSVARVMGLLFTGYLLNQPLKAGLWGIHQTIEGLKKTRKF